MATPFLDEIITAGAGGIPTTELWQEIKALVAGTSGRKGSLTLAGKAGATATIIDIGTTSYDVYYWIAGTSSAGNIGEITINIASATSFTVYNSGSNNTAVLNFWAVPK